MLNFLLLMMTSTYLDRDVLHHTLCDTQHFTFFNSSILRIFIQTVTVTVIQKSHSLLVKVSLPIPLEIDTKIKRIILTFKLDPYTSFWRAKEIWRNIISLVVKTKPNETKQTNLFDLICTYTYFQCPSVFSSSCPVDV